MHAKNPVTPELLADSFVEYLKEQDLLPMLPEIAERLSAEANRRYEITVIAAGTLGESEKRELAASLVEKFGDHPVSYLVDPAMVSGVIARFRDTVIDLSGRRQLTDLATHLKTTN